MHSIISPSSFGQLAHCAGAPLMQAQFQDHDNPAAAEGTAAHWLGAEAMPIFHAGTWYARELAPVGTLAPNGVLITQAIRNGAALWVEAVSEAMDRAGPGAQLHVEERLDIKAVHDVSFGTPDAWVWMPAHGELHVYDFKFGFGVVEAFRNWQGAGYVRGILDHLSIDGHAEQHLQIWFHIIQPRADHRLGPIRSWRVGDDLRGMINILHSQAALALTADPPVRTGGGCKHCTARHACPALQRAGFDVLSVTELATALEPSGAALALEMDLLHHGIDVLKARLSGLEDHALAQIVAGKSVPGFTRGHGRGRLEWSVPAEEVAALGDMLGADLRKPMAVITPTQAKKVIDETVINSYAVKQPGQAKLERLDVTLAQQVFGNGKN